MSYIDDARAELEQQLARTGHDCGGDLLGLYTLLVLTTGDATTLEHVHDAWSVWTAGLRPEHRSLIRFEDLTNEVQDLDGPYRDAIRAAARELATS